MRARPGALALTALAVAAALAGVELTLRAGEVHALMGQNGAGKSTLIKVLTGVYAPDAGSIELLGQPITPQSPIHAQHLGISAVHQESHLLPNLSVAENICAGRYPRKPWTRGGGIDWRKTERRARELLAGLGIELDLTQLAGGLPAALQQLATVARDAPLRGGLESLAVGPVDRARLEAFCDEVGFGGLRKRLLERR